MTRAVNQQKTVYRKTHRGASRTVYDDFGPAVIRRAGDCHTHVVLPVVIDDVVWAERTMSLLNSQSCQINITIGKRKRVYS
jgi:hypothetical protein